TIKAKDTADREATKRAEEMLMLRDIAEFEGEDAKLQQQRTQQQLHKASAEKAAAARRAQQQTAQQQEWESLAQNEPRLLPNGVPLARLELNRSMADEARRRIMSARTRCADDPTVTVGARPNAASVAAAAAALARDTSASATLLVVVRSSRQRAAAAATAAAEAHTKAVHAAAAAGAPWPDTSDAAVEAATAALGGAATARPPSGTGEPLLNEDFFEAMKSHFNEMASNQTAQLQSKLNTGLPDIMKQFGVKHVSPGATLKATRPAPAWPP
ncbi:hypothetical protein FOA52_008217, partial [Chlamydomonas sp. UWO 241]